MTTPDAAAGDGLREALKLWLDDRAERFDAWSYPDDEAYADADAVLALPALRDVLAAATRDAEFRRRVEEFRSELSENPHSDWTAGDVVIDLDRALGPS